MQSSEQAPDREPEPDQGPQRDADVVRLLERRDPEGLRQLLRRHGPRVRGTLAAEFRALSEMDLDSAINAAAHRAWDAVGTYRSSKGTLRAWFYVIAKNCLRDGLRRDERQMRHVRLHEFETLEPTVARPAAEVSPQAATPPFVEVLRDCVHKLPRLQRAIIEADLESSNTADSRRLADELGTTINSIRASRSMARRALRRHLQRAGFDPSPESETPSPSSSSTTSTPP